MPAELREELLLHLESCASCTEQVKGIMALEPDTGRMAAVVAPAFGRAKPRGSNRWLPLAAAASVLAAVVLTVVLVDPTSFGPGADQNDSLRGPATGLVPGHRASLDRMPLRITWVEAFGQPVRVRLMDEAADTLWHSPPVEGSTVDLPAALPGTSGTYLWQIEDQNGRVLAGPYWFVVR